MAKIPTNVPAVNGQAPTFEAFYGTGSNKDNAVYGFKNGYTPFGELVDRGLQKYVHSHDYNRIISKRYGYASEYLDNAKKNLPGESEFGDGPGFRRIEKQIQDMSSQVQQGDLASTGIQQQILNTLNDMNKRIANAEKNASSAPPASGGEGGGEEDSGEESPYEALKKFYNSWQESFRSEQQHTRQNEAILSIFFQQVVDIAKAIEQGVKQGRDASNKIYESNVANVASRGVNSKFGLAFETDAIGAQLLADGLYADLKINDIFQGYVDLVNKGYSDKDAEALAYSDAITKKIAPYLDTQSTAFKDLQSKFGQNFMTQISGMNNYIQEIAGSAKVFEANINNIVTQLEPIQLWAEKQMWGEDELAALDYLVEQGGMTQTQAASLIQSALKVTTGQYSSVTGGTTAEKVAVATGQTDFGSALSSILSTSGLASSGNQIAQGAALSALGGSSFISENADIPALLGMFSTGMSLAQNSATTVGEKTAENIDNLKDGMLSSQSEIKETLTNNSGAMLSFMKDFAPAITEKLDKMFSVECILDATTSYIAILQSRQLVQNVANNATGLLAKVGDSGLGKFATTALSSGGTAMASAAPAVGTMLGIIGATVGTIAGVAGIAKLVGKNQASSGEFGQLASYDVGTDYVDYDQLAYIHKGEAVLTPEENSTYQQKKKQTTDITSSLMNSTITVKIEQEEKNDKLIRELREEVKVIVAAIQKYCQQERTFTYDQDTISFKNEEST